MSIFKGGMKLEEFCNADSIRDVWYTYKPLRVKLFYDRTTAGLRTHTVMGSMLNNTKSLVSRQE